MPLKSRIHAHQVELPESIRARIETRIGKLDEFYDRIQSCDVAIEGPGAHHHRGPHTVRLAIAVPKREIVVDRQSAVSLEVAVREAFAAADRQLEDYARRLRGDVKSRSGRTRGIAAIGRKARGRRGAAEG